MERYGHNNLLTYGNRDAVYQSLQHDYNRDVWMLNGMSLVFAGLGFGGIINRPDLWWLFAFGFVAVWLAMKYVDNSNRNWAMHLIDWMEREDSENTPGDDPQD